MRLKKVQVGAIETNGGSEKRVFHLQFFLLFPQNKHEIKPMTDPTQSISSHVIQVIKNKKLKEKTPHSRYHLGKWNCLQMDGDFRWRDLNWKCK